MGTKAEYKWPTLAVPSNRAKSKINMIFMVQKQLLEHHLGFKSTNLENIHFPLKAPYRNKKDTEMTLNLF